MSAQNASSVWSSVVVYLDYNGTGPAISLFPLVGGHNPTWYSSDVAAASPSGTPITVDGTVDITNLAGSIVYWVYQNPGSPQTGSITHDMFGFFSFTFYPGGYPSGQSELSGNLTIQVKAKDNRDIESTASYICYDDTTPPSVPAVSGPPSPTNDTTPTWTWTTPATTVDLQYSLVGPTGPWTVTTDTSYTLDPPLANGSRTLWVRARDALGNCSSAGSYPLIVDTVPPAAPTVNAPASPTNDDTPTWSWNTPTGTAAFQYSLNAPAGPWTNTTEDSWTASPALVPADPYTDYTLFVQGRDAAGNWSASGSDTVRVDTTPPPAPTVTGPSSPTSDITPRWTWDTPGDAMGFRRSLDSGGWITTSANSWTASPAFESGETHTLAVQARDAAGNWSDSGSYTVIIN